MRSESSELRAPINAVFCISAPGAGVNGVLSRIAESGVRTWISPERVDDQVWARATERERREIRHDRVRASAGQVIDAYRYRVPGTTWDAFHAVAGKLLLWPIFHSFDPALMQEPERLLTGGYEAPEEIHFSFDDCDDRWRRYKECLELGRSAVARLKTQGRIPEAERFWAIDYLTSGAGCEYFSFRIPFPPLSYLRKVQVNGQPLLTSRFFSELMAQYAAHKAITFHRRSDVQNFMDVLQAVGILRQGALPRVVGPKIPYGIHVGPSRSIRNVSLMAVPTGVDHSGKVEEALAHGRLDSRYEAAPLRETGIVLDGALPDRDGFVTLRQLLGSALEDGHRIFLAGHRDDYIKSTLEKLVAVERYFERHPEEIGTTHFAFFLHRTYLRLPYHAAVCAKARELRERFGDSVIVTNEGIDHGDYLALMREENVIGFLGVARIEGHDTTVREAIAVNMDKRDAKLAIIVSDGIGAADVVGGKESAPGAFVVRGGHVSMREFVEGLVRAFEEIVSLNASPSGIRVLQQRFSVMRDASERYTPSQIQYLLRRVVSEGGRQVSLDRFQASRCALSYRRSTSGHHANGIVREPTRRM